jgi:hypothetical protein
MRFVDLLGTRSSKTRSGCSLRCGVEPISDEHFSVSLLSASMQQMVCHPLLHSKRRSKLTEICRVILGQYLHHLLSHHRRSGECLRDVSHDHLSRSPRLHLQLRLHSLYRQKSRDHYWLQCMCTLPIVYGSGLDRPPWVKSRWEMRRCVHLTLHLLLCRIL